MCMILEKGSLDPKTFNKFSKFQNHWTSSQNTSITQKYSLVTSTIPNFRLFFFFNMYIFNFDQKTLMWVESFLSIFFLCVFLVVVIMLIISLYLALINIYPHWYASFCDDDNSKCSRHSTIYSIIFLLLDISFSYPFFFFLLYLILE